MHPRFPGTSSDFESPILSCHFHLLFDSTDSVPPLVIGNETDFSELRSSLWTVHSPKELESSNHFLRASNHTLPIYIIDFGHGTQGCESIVAISNPPKSRSGSLASRTLNTTRTSIILGPFRHSWVIYLIIYGSGFVFVHKGIVWEILLKSWVIYLGKSNGFLQLIDYNVFVNEGIDREIILHWYNFPNITMWMLRTLNSARHIGRRWQTRRSIIVMKVVEYAPWTTEASSQTICL